VNSLVALPILLPLLGAALSLAARRSPALQRAASLAVLGAVVAIAAVLMVQADRSGPQVLWVGGWVEPVGIALVADRLSALMVLVSALVTLIVLVFAIGQGQADDEESRTPVSIFHPTYLMLTAGVSNAFLAGDLFNLFVGFEILLFASYVLLTIGGTGERIQAGSTYVVVSIVSSSLFLIGIIGVYAATGTVNLARVSERLEHVGSGVTLSIQLALLVAFGIKAAVFPMSGWLPDSYPTAPAPVTAVFAGLLTKVGIYAMIRVQTLLFPHSPLTGLLMVAGLVTMIVGILGAVSQSGLKRILSFTLVSHIGYMVFGIALATPHGTAGAIFYVVHHITIQAALFLIAGLVERLGGTSALDRLGGLATASPVLAVIFFVAAMNLSGIPPLSGFLAKVGLFQAGAELGTPLAWTVVAGGILTSLLTLYALAKAWSQAFWRPLAETRATLALAGPGNADSEEVVRSDATSTIEAVTPVFEDGGLPDFEEAGTTLLEEASADTDNAFDEPGRHPLPSVMMGAAAAMTALGMLIALLAGPLFAYTERAATDLLARQAYLTAVLDVEVTR
jgi:multicomponent Na+:H+ antiporter subunit D